MVPRARVPARLFLDAGTVPEDASRGSEGGADRERKMEIGSKTETQFLKAVALIRQSEITPGNFDRSPSPL